MPGQRRTAGPRARGSWLPRLAGIAVVVVLAAGGVTGYLLVQHPAAVHHAAALPSRVQSYQTVGLIARNAQPGSSADQLLQLLGSQDKPEFGPLGQAQEAQGSPQWTADLMAGGSYIFIFLPTGDCLSAASAAGQPRLMLQHCDLTASQRWRRTKRAVIGQGHDFYQYANLGDDSCLTEGSTLAGQTIGAGLTPCAAPAAADQLIAFWWSAV